MNGFSALLSGGNSGRLARSDAPVEQQQHQHEGNGGGGGGCDDFHVKGPSILVFSGGTAFNGVVEELKKLTTRVAHVLPVSDDGGSTAEIVRVLGDHSPRP